MSLAWSDLERVLRQRRPHTSSWHRRKGDPYLRATDDELAEEAGVCRETIERMRATGTCNPFTAERIAEHLGEHPVAIWGWDWSLHVDDNGRLHREEVRC